MVYTGSIGLHHVIRGPHDGEYATSAVNDLRTVEVPPLSLVSATSLAKVLLHGEGLKSDPQGKAAEAIATLVDCVPYYIHHVVASLADQGQAASPELAAEVVKRALTGAQDPWDLEHYRERLRPYYGEQAGVARGILDQLAESPLSLEDLQDRLQVGFRADNEASRRIAEGSPENLRALVKLMRRDHYLHLGDHGEYSFRSNLIRRWWRFELGIR